jgi:hypothetical protein
MTTSGWTGDPPDAEGPAAAGGFAGFIESMRGDPADRPDPLTRARMAADKPGDPYDNDERAANLMGRGYAAGHVSDLAQRYTDTMSELATVQEANEAARKRQERIAREHAAGRITAFDIMRMDTAEPDTAREQQLGRRAESLRQQIEGASAMIAPPQARDADPYEAANRAAHELFRATTRQRMAEAQSRRPAARPFGSASRGGVAARSETRCPRCQLPHERYGMTEAECYLICNDPAPEPVPDVVSEDELEWYARQTGQAYRPAERRGQGSYGLAVR